MPRPATKEDLITAANEQFDKMWALIDSMTEEELAMPFDFGDDPKDKELTGNVIKICGIFSFTYMSGISFC